MNAVLQPERIRLNLGCGSKLLPGYVNVDFESNHSGKKPDVSCDLRKLCFPDDYADEVMAIHVFEHFYVWEAEDLLLEWVRVLKPGGLLVLELPCLDKILIHFSGPNPTIGLTWWGLYGDPTYKDPRMMHKWGWSKPMLNSLLVRHLDDVRDEHPQFHVPKRDMRMTGRKRVL